MTDIIDYQVDKFEPSVFEHSIHLPAANVKEQNYYDLVSLISLLTQFNEINYQIINDFFLTYRSFISQKSLLKVLLVRIRWCFNSISDLSHESRQNIGKLTLVRTFVMIRHWLLNYFSDDFIPSTELRQLFITSINELEHHEIFVQRIVGNLKQVWSQCCNKYWDEDIKSNDYYSFNIKIGPQGSKHKRLSAFAITQQNDPFTRNSVMLSAFDKKTIHKLPIPINQPVKSIKGTKYQPKVTLNPMNSNYRLSQVVAHQIRTASDDLQKKNTLYVPLNSSLASRSRNTIRDCTEFPKTPTLSKIIPPTPVKKMDINVPLPSVTKTEQPQRGLRPLIESWIKTFHRHNVSVKDSKHPENLLKTVVSVAKIDSTRLDLLAEGKFDILSARTIDELEYLVRFHNELLNKYGTKIGQSPVNDSFSFTIDEPYESILNEAPFTKGASNIDNMNICETISKISQSVVSLQQLNEHAGSRKSYISYDSLYSRQHRSLDNLDDLKCAEDAALRKKTRVSNLREFNFETSKEATGSNERSSLDSFPSSILSESTPNEISLESDGEDDAKSALHTTRSPAQDSQETVLLESSQISAKDVETEISAITKPSEIDSVDPAPTPNFEDQEPTSTDTPAPETIVSEVSPVVIEEPTASEPGRSTSVITSGTVFHDSHENLEQRYSNSSSLADHEYDEIESFVSSYEELDDPSHGLSNNQASLIFNEPNTPPATAINDGLISSGDHISPIKPITEDHVFHKTSLECRESQPQRVSQPVEEQLDLNKVPSVCRISNGSVATRSPQVKPPNLDRQLSYLSQRSKRASEHSMNSSFFSGQDKNNKIVNITVKSETIDKSAQHNKVSADTSKESLNPQSSHSISLVNSIDSNEYDIPYPGVNNEVIAELAGITDGSIQDDPITAALLKLEGQYKSRKAKEVNEQSDSSFDSKELSRQVNSLDIQTPVPSVKKQQTRNSLFLDQRRKTRMFSLTPVKQKDVTQNLSSSKLLLELLLSRKLDNDVLNVSNTEQHVSFILNFDSKTIAEQFTLIERDSLMEIDWKELVQLEWDSTNLVPINSWLELLIQNEDIHGVDLCISRFNLTVNWIISEILLTKDITLRKLTIQRFIHVAQYCKDIQNFSTLMQILLALGSDKVLKLKETWRCLEPGDILTYKSLESIASPLKNFFSLRTQLNQLKPSLGCVPFLGLYLSDLLFNKEKNSCMDNKINFGKFKHDSKIVRSLIQCIQWSTLYKFEVNDEVLSKCLYIKSLTEEEMLQCLEDLK